MKEFVPGAEKPHFVKHSIWTCYTVDAQGEKDNEGYGVTPKDAHSNYRFWLEFSKPPFCEFMAPPKNFLEKFLERMKGVYNRGN